MSLLTDARRERASKQIIQESRARCGVVIIHGLSMPQII